MDFGSNDKTDSDLMKKKSNIDGAAKPAEIFGGQYLEAG